MDQVIKCMLRVIFRFLVVASLIILFTNHAEAAREIVAIQSVNAKLYEEAFRGFKDACDAARVHRIIISETRGEDPIERLSVTRPDLVLAIGMDALSRVRNLRDIPVVYVMVFDSGVTPSSKNHITGVNMCIAPENQFNVLLDVLPQTKTVGLLYDPGRTEELVKEVQTAAERNRASLIASKVNSAKNVPISIMEMRGKIDVFWMIPDLTVVTPETVEFLLLFSLENNTPIITFSEKYVEMGALISVGVDPFDMGRQAGEIAERILSGVAVSSIPEVYAREAVVSVSLKVAKKLGITINENIAIRAKMID